MIHLHVWSTAGDGLRQHVIGKASECFCEPAVVETPQGVWFIHRGAAVAGFDLPPLEEAPCAHDDPWD